MELVLISLASLLAGGIDSIVGGGGLILVPALFAVYPTTAPATLFGTNKSASVWGTSIATVQYARRVQIRWAVLLPAAGAALVGSFIGAWVVTLIDPTFLRRLLPFILLAVLLYTLAKKDLGRTHAPRHAQGRETLLACAIGAVIGWYDGFFGPGTGSFFIFLFVRLLGYDFLNASAAAKLVDVSPCFTRACAAATSTGARRSARTLPGSVWNARILSGVMALSARSSRLICRARQIS